MIERQRIAEEIKGWVTAGLLCPGLEADRISDDLRAGSLVVPSDVERACEDLWKSGLGGLAKRLLEECNERK